MATGVNETLSLDRATVRKDALDPASLNATCTPLDGGDIVQGVDVTVVDLRRLSGGNRLISAVLHVDGAEAEDAEAGEHEATLQLGEANQSTTTYTGTATLAEGGCAGTLELTDAAGNALTGTFDCAAEPLPTTTAVPDTGGDNEAVPGTPAPTAPTTPEPPRPGRGRPRTAPRSGAGGQPGRPGRLEGVDLGAWRSVMPTSSRPFR